MNFQSAIALNELKTAGRHRMMLDNHDILLLWHENEVHAIQAKCPHLKLPLMKGTLTKACEIVCPFHKSAFNLKTGDVAAWSPWPPFVGPLLGKLSKEKQLQVYPTKIENEMVWVDVG